MIHHSIYDVKKGIKKTSLSLEMLFIITYNTNVLAVNYTRVTLPDFKARVLTYTRFGLPSTKMRTF